MWLYKTESVVRLHTLASHLNEVNPKISYDSAFFFFQRGQCANESYEFWSRSEVEMLLNEYKLDGYQFEEEDVPEEEFKLIIDELLKLFDSGKLPGEFILLISW